MPQAENILIESSPQTESTGLNRPILGIKLVDFGFVSDPSDAQARRPRRTSRVGTPGWVAKEVVATEEYDAQAIDMWGLGTLLYVVLCKQMPYTDAETCKRTTDMPAIPWKPTHVWARNSAEVKDIVQGLLCPSPEDRLTAAAVLRHPWIVSHCGACELEEDDSMERAAAAIMEEIEARASTGSSADSSSSAQPPPAGAGLQGEAQGPAGR